MKIKLQKYNNILRLIKLLDSKKTKKIFKIINNIFVVLLALLLGLIIILTVSTKVFGRQNGFFGYHMLTVLSGSMEPNIKTGSIILVKTNINLKEIKAGDVITFKAPDNPNMLISHRVIKIEKSKSKRLQFITKGDNNDANDPAVVMESNVMGVYKNLTVPNIGYFFGFLKSKTGAVVLLIAPGLLMIISQLIVVAKTIINLEKNKEKESIST